MTEIEQAEEEIAVIKEVFDDEVLIQIERKGACRSCSLNMLCMGGENKAEFRIRTALNLKPGDRVKLNIKPESRLISSFLIFVFPILMMIIFFVTAHYLLSLSEGISIVISLAGLLFSGFIIKYIDKKSSEKISVEIVEKLDKAMNKDEI